MPTRALDSGCWSLVADLTLGWALSGTGEEGGQATLVVVLRECVFGEGAGRVSLLDTESRKD